MLTVRKIVASAAVAALITTGSSAAIAQTSAPARATTQQSTNPWVTLSMLTPVSASTLGGAAATAAQPTNDQGQPQGIGSIPIEVLIGWLAMLILIIYLGTKGNGHHHANSPP